MTAPHETPVPGRAADFAAALAARLPVLETARLRLRAPVLADFPAWAEVFCGPAGADLGGPFDRDDAFREFGAAVGLWLLRGHGVWTLVARDGGDAALGFVLVGFEPGDREPELGFLLTAAAEGQGLAAEAAAAARDWALGAMRLPSLVSYVAPGNARSRALVRRLDARPDGHVDGAEVWRHDAPAPETAA